MIEVVEIIGVGLCLLGLAAYVFYQIQLGIDTYDEDWTTGAVVESVYTADLKSAGLRPCGFESRPRYQILKWKQHKWSKEPW